MQIEQIEMIEEAAACARLEQRASEAEAKLREHAARDVRTAEWVEKTRPMLAQALGVPVEFVGGIDAALLTLAAEAVALRKRCVELAAERTSDRNTAHPLNTIAAEISTALGPEYVVTCDHGEHHSAGKVQLHYSIGIYLNKPWRTVAQFHRGDFPVQDDVRDVGSSESVARRAREWLAVGIALRDVGAQGSTVK